MGKWTNGQMDSRCEMDKWTNEQVDDVSGDRQETVHLSICPFGRKNGANIANKKLCVQRKSVQKMDKWTNEQMAGGARLSRVLLLGGEGTPPPPKLTFFEARSSIIKTSNFKRYMMYKFFERSSTFENRALKV